MNSQFLYRPCLSLILNLAIIALIVGLLFCSGPPHIAGLIMSFTYAINRVFGRRTWTNFFQEFLKRQETTFNASTSIDRIVRVMGIFTAILQPHKRLVFDSFTHAVRAATKTRFLIFQAAATITDSSLQIITKNNLLHFTLATTEPLSLSSMSIDGSFKNNPTSEPLTSQINEMRHTAPPRVPTGESSGNLAWTRRFGMHALAALCLYLGWSAFPSPVNAAVRFVANCGSNSDDGTTADCSNGSGHKPWATMAKVLGASGIVSGDTVYLAPGSIFRETVTVAMTSATVETKVLGDPLNTQGFKDASGVRIAPAYVTWTAFTTNDTTTPATTSTLDLAGADFLTFENIWFVQGNISAAGTATIAAVTATSTNITVRRCVFSGGTIQLSSRYVIVAANAADVAFHWLVEQNIFWSHNVAMIDFSGATSSTADYDLDVLIQNNRFIWSGFVTTTGAPAIIVDASGALSFKAGGVRVYNNTFIGVRGLSVINANISTASGKKCEFYNNYVDMAALSFGSATTSGQISSDYNMGNAGTTANNITDGGHSKLGGTYAPLLEIGQAELWGFPARSFFSPSAGSPVLGFGSSSPGGTLTPPTVDLLGTSRPSGGQSLSYAVGAQERRNTWTLQNSVTQHSGDAIQITGPGMGNYYVDVTAGTAVTLSVWMRYDTNYSTTTKPQMMVLNSEGLGCTAQTMTMSSGVDTWEKLTMASCTPTASGTMTIRLVSRSAAANGLAYAQDEATGTPVIRRPPPGVIQ
jgi:hypothetical protein